MQYFNSFTEKAFKAYEENDYTLSIFYWNKAGRLLGAEKFLANLDIAKKKLSEQRKKDPEMHYFKKIKVCAIMDKFTEISFSNECELLQLRPEIWKKQIIEFDPVFIFIESAWKGIDSLWESKISKPNEETKSLIAWCREINLPIVFWNKEDPVHFERFLHIAKSADYVFTVDYDMIGRYKKFLNHNNIYLLPFSAQTSQFNPLEKFSRKDKFCFAGSYSYKYPERVRDLKKIGDLAKSIKGIDIFDRNIGIDGLEFPEEYKNDVKGSLCFEEIDKAYKGYKYGITMNSVKDSSSMFARRCFEMLASNTMVISNYSRGVHNFFGDLVISSDNTQRIQEQFEKFNENSNISGRFRLKGLRKVLLEHTTQKRFEYLLKKIGIPYFKRPPYAILIGRCETPVQKQILISSFKRQMWKYSHLCLLQTFEDKKRNEEKIIIFKSITEIWDAIKDENKQTFIGFLNYKNFYGENYLTDLILGSIYSKETVLGKGTFYASDNGNIVIKNEGFQYKLCEHLNHFSSIIRLELLNYDLLKDIISQNKYKVSLTGLALDEFSFILNGSSLPLEKIKIVEDINLSDEGLHVSEIIGKSERITAVKSSKKCFNLTGTELNKLIKSTKNIIFSSIGNSLKVSSCIEEGFEYIYINKFFSKEELNFINGDIIKLFGSGDLDVRLVLVFYDKNKAKIFHKFVDVNNDWIINLNSNIKFVRLGIRVEGKGEYIINELIGVSTGTGYPLFKNSILAIGRYFPCYDDEDNHGIFAFNKLNSFKKNNFIIDFFKIREQNEYGYSEYKGINIITGSISHLKLALDSGNINCLMVFAIDRSLWNFIKLYKNKIKFIFYLEKYFEKIIDDTSKEYPFLTLPEIEKNDLTKDSYTRLFNDIIKYANDFQFVFSSEYQKKKFVNFFDIKDDINFEIFPDLIETDENTLKRPEDRFNILICDSFQSRKYANDLITKSLYYIKEKPWFNDFYIKIFGEGCLFDETVAPIKNIKNIKILNKKLNDKELKQQINNNGILVSPARMEKDTSILLKSMAGGLVPITSYVGSIPEKVSEYEGFLLPVEDYNGIGQALKFLHENPDLYMEMSRASIKKIKYYSNKEVTIAKELNFILSPIHKKNIIENGEIIVYGHMGLNYIDGSSMWMQNVCSILARNHKIIVLCKRNLKPGNVLEQADYQENIITLQPADFCLEDDFSEGRAADILAYLSYLIPAAPIILRGYKIAELLTKNKFFKGKLNTYFHGFYQPEDIKYFEIKENVIDMAYHLLGHSDNILIQTPICAQEFEKFFGHPFRHSLLPPSVSDKMIEGIKREKIEDGKLHIGYGGKIYPNWGIEELLTITEQLYKDGIQIEVHLVVSKIFQVPAYKEKIEKLLKLPHVKVIRNLTRRQTMEIMNKMDLIWCWRPGDFENTIPDFSTKLIENAVQGLPCICYPSKAQKYLLGDDYPYFCKDKIDIMKLFFSLKKETLNKKIPRNIEDYKQSNISITL